MTNKYQFNLVWSDLDKEYMATCPEFPGLSAFGKNPEEALAEAQIALELFIETYKEDGIPLPEPQTKPEYSGQIRLRLPKSLHAQAAKLAANDEISLNQFICNAIQAKVSGQQVSNALSAIIGKPDLSELIRSLYSRRNLSFREPQFNNRWVRFIYSGHRQEPYLSCRESKEYSNPAHMLKLTSAKDEDSFYIFDYK